MAKPSRSRWKYGARAATIWGLCVSGRPNSGSRPSRLPAAQSASKTKFESTSIFNWRAESLGARPGGSIMIQFHWRRTVRVLVCLLGVAGLFAFEAVAQYPGGGSPPPSGGPPSGSPAMGNPPGPTSGAPTSIYNFHSNYHIGFDKPEAWGLKYFASTSLLSGLQPPAPPEGYHLGSV